MVHRFLAESDALRETRVSRSSGPRPGPHFRWPRARWLSLGRRTALGFARPRAGRLGRRTALGFGPPRAARLGRRTAFGFARPRAGRPAVEMRGASDTDARL